MLEWWNILVDAERILLLAALAALVVLLIYYLFFFLRLAFYKSPEKKENNLPPVSVIICARNEAENIIHFLPKVLNQDYPDFEVVVVDDQSWDGTGDELAELQKTNHHLQIVSIGEQVQHLPGKKFPLTLGIKKAKNEHLVFTDADCFPQSDQWLKLMTSSFSQQKEIVIAPAPLVARKGFLNILIRFENLVTGGMFLSFALAGNPYMGVGRNLAYTRSVYTRAGGFKKHYHIASGDDDLLVQAVAKRGNTAVCIADEALVFSPAAKTWKEWAAQKSRHYSTSHLYKWKYKMMLGLYPLSIILFLTTIIGLLVFDNTRHIALILLATKLLVQMAIFRLVFKVQKDRLLWLLSPILEVLLLGNQVIIMMIGRGSKSSKWK